MKKIAFFSLLFICFFHLTRGQGYLKSNEVPTVPKSKFAPSDTALKIHKAKLDSIKHASISNTRELPQAQVRQLIASNQSATNFNAWKEQQTKKFNNSNALLATAFSSKMNISKLFPFPPVSGYTNALIPGDVFKDCKNLEKVNQKIAVALDKCGYRDMSYYTVPGGFAIVTGLEKIDDADGSTVNENDRFAITCSDKMRVTDVVSPQKGCFREIAFVVTNTTFALNDPKSLRSIAPNWIADRTIELPKTVGDTRFGKDYHCFVLVYEYKAPSAGTHLLPVWPTMYSATEHLHKSGIDQLLVK